MTHLGLKLKFEFFVLNLKKANCQMKFNLNLFVKNLFFVKLKQFFVFLNLKK